MITKPKVMYFIFFMYPWSSLIFIKSNTILSFYNNQKYVLLLFFTNKTYLIIHLKYLTYLIVIQEFLYISIKFISSPYNSMYKFCFVIQFLSYFFNMSIHYPIIPEIIITPYCIKYFFSSKHSAFILYQE